VQDFDFPPSQVLLSIMPIFTDGFFTSSLRLARRQRLLVSFGVLFFASCFGSDVGQTSTTSELPGDTDPNGDQSALVASDTTCVLTVRGRHFHQRFAPARAEAEFIRYLADEGVSDLAPSELARISCQPDWATVDVFAEPVQAPSSIPYWAPGAPDSLTDQALRELLPRARFYTTRTMGSLASLRSLIGRFKRQRPNVPFLIYAWSDRFDPSRNVDSLTDGVILKRVFTDAAGKVRCDRAVCDNGVPTSPVAYGRVWDADYRVALIESVQEFIDATGADGVNFDLSIVKPTCPTNPKPYLADFCTKHQVGMQALFALARARLKKADGTPAFVGFNGLWNESAQASLADQITLLPYADGAAIEWFGLQPQGLANTPWSLASPPIDFETSVKPYLNLMRPGGAAQGSFVYVYGRAPWSYGSYDDTYLLQRWTWAAYLLGANGPSRFHFHSVFSVEPSAGRVGGTDLFVDQDLLLGPATSNRIEIVPNVEKRVFRGGEVYVRLQASPAARVPGPIVVTYTLEGRVVPAGSQLDLRTGAEILLYQKPPLRGPLRFDIGGVEYAALIDRPRLADGARGFQRFAKSVTPWVNDIALDTVRQLRPRSAVAAVVRGDVESTLDMVAEIDDSAQKDAFMTVQFACSKAPSTVAALPLFGRPSVTAINGPVESIGAPALCSQNWVTLSLPGERRFENCGGTAGRTCTVRRWVLARPQSVDVAQFVLRN
jgi:hypothetical protein